MSVAADTASFADDILGRDVNSEDTASRYARWAKRFEAWRPGGDITTEMLRDFDTVLEDEDQPDYPWENSRGKPAPASYAYQTRVSALSGVKLWAEYHYDTRIEKEVQNIAVGEPADFDPTILDPAEVQSVINAAGGACDNPSCEAAIRVGYDAIMRGAEVAGAKVEDVDPDEQALYVRAVKGSEPTTISLGNGAWLALKRHTATIGDREYLFHNDYENPWTPAAWNQHFRRKHHPAGFHAFARHSAITNRIRDGEDFGDVYLRARHQNPATTLKYSSLVGADAPGWADA